MSEYPTLFSVTRAKALLTGLGEVKDGYGELDAAVWNHLRDGRERAVRRAHHERVGQAVVGALTGPPGVYGLFALLNGASAFGQEISVLPPEASPFPLVVAACVGAGAYARHAWVMGAGRFEAREADAYRHCEKFLRAGVRVEVALDGLALALRDAGRGGPGSEAALESQSHDTRQALEEYATAVQKLDESEVSSSDMDVARALTLLEVKGDVLAQLQEIAAESHQLEAPPRPGAPQGGLPALIADAGALRQDLAVVGSVLETLENAIHQATRRMAEEHHGTLESVTRAVSDAQLYQILVESDCLVVESVARSATEAHAVPSAVAHMRDLPSAQTMVTAFEGYARHLHEAVTQLTGFAFDRALREAGVTAWHLWSDLPRLRQAVQAVAVAAHAQLRHINTLATSRT